MALIPERLPGERLLIKIWQTVTDRGIGGLLSPWQIKREGKAHADVRRYEIQTLAKQDAALIEKIAPFVSARSLIHQWGKLDELLKSNGVNDDLLLELLDLGIMSDIGKNLHLNVTITPPANYPFRFWNKALVVSAPAARRLALQIYGVTEVGRQVMSLGKFKANDEFVLAVGNLILERGFEVALGDVEEKPTGEYRVVGQPLVSPASTGTRPP